MSDAQIAALERRHAHLRSQLAAVGEMRSGTLTERCRRCGKASCGCADRGASGRGPVLSLTRKQDGKTVTRLIPADAGAEVQAQNAEYRRFRELSKALVEVSDALSEARLAAGRPRPAAPPRRGGKKGGPAEAFAAGINLKIATGIAELVGPGASGQDFEAFEQAVRRGVLDAAAGEVEHQLNADRTDSCGPTVVCACGQTARYAGRRPKTFGTVLGPVTLERAYYYCAACRAGVCPRDQALGLHGTALSPALTRMVGLVAADGSFADASGLLSDLTGMRIGAKQVERTAEALGCAVAADERGVVEPAPAAAPTMYLGLDGTGVPVRKSETAGRRGKQPDGSAKTREVKLVTVWTAETRDGNGLPVRDRGSVSYSAAVESAAGRALDPRPSPFAQRAYREARRRGFDTAPRRVVIGDGAEWIWNLSAEQFPGAIEIVDLYHAKGHLCDVAKAVYGAGTDLAARWGKDRRDELDAGRIDAVLTALRPHRQTCDEARKCIDYLTRNRHRMRYAEFRAWGLCVSSGVVEAGCKHAIGARLKRAGMHWTVAGANAIIALRLSGRFEDFWERRAAKAA